MNTIRFYFMSKTKQQKQVALDGLTRRIREAKSVVFSTFAHLDIQKQEALRKELRAAGVSFNVFKKTLIKKALEAENINTESIDEWRGNVGVATSAEEVAPAKILMSVAKKEEGITVHLGILEGKRIEVEGVMALALIPGKEQLLGKLVGSLQSPLYGLASVLQGTQRQFIYLLQQIKK
jgi:large subunit ribosomal protein L10